MIIRRAPPRRGANCAISRNRERPSPICSSPRANFHTSVTRISDESRRCHHRRRRRATRTPSRRRDRSSPSDRNSETFSQPRVTFFAAALLDDARVSFSLSPSFPLGNLMYNAFPVATVKSGGGGRGSGNNRGRKCICAENTRGGRCAARARARATERKTGGHRERNSDIRETRSHFIDSASRRRYTMLAFRPAGVSTDRVSRSRGSRTSDRRGTRR